ncbi:MULTISPECIES: NAD(P)/FAD-dependent oxidoreductase [unclassified Prochlorococcus]|uniref:NAD(P)/FAD-dependent oxidoreductase n=1 Tax=unclassified Prochlorococcus TaxID=2627481 RepID=UPI000533B8CA|nr:MULTISPECIES: FAD-dependent oxidoreductase [unclassified Prochlorococcus]KGG14512.1 D-amino acid dehydrogenase small subunit [Prochlorococcus sp. MIT 0602]KGG16063.1 D-amino acid dehydrogenase small subunit [Prochlorococcus sp. MIT 0603]
MNKKEIAIIGGGIIGSTTAFYLAKLGHNITIIDPELDRQEKDLKYRTGTKASLGIIMGNTFRRSSGRSWRLRQRSMELWPKWLEQLSIPNIPLKIETPLIQIASNAKEMKRMYSLINERKELGLEALKNNQTNQKSRNWPESIYGGLISNQDGRINPTTLMKCLIVMLKKLNVEKINKKVGSLNYSLQNNQKKWILKLDDNNKVTKDFVILCSGLHSEFLLESINKKLPMESVLGQAIKLVLKEDYKNWDDWPAVLSCHGFNLIPQNKNEIILGATLEPGRKPNEMDLKKMKTLNGFSPQWLDSASVEDYWYGIRIKPANQAAPLLEEVQPGLILNTAHYRNGFLLAPACAEWVGNRI